MLGHFKDGFLKTCDDVCVGRRGGRRIREVKEILGGGMKRLRRQFLGRKMHTRPCVSIILRRIIGGRKQIKQFQKQWERRLKRRLLDKKIAQMKCFDL